MNATMRRISMTVPATQIPLFVPAGGHFSQARFMAAKAIFLDDGDGSPGKFDGLRFATKSKDGGMSQTVMGFESVFTRQRRMRHMAIVAMGSAGVRIVFPGNIRVRHHMTIHAGFRVIAQIGRGT